MTTCQSLSAHANCWQKFVSTSPSRSRLLQCICPLLAQSGHFGTLSQCPLSGVKRTFAAWSTSSSAIDALRLAYFYALMPLEGRAVLMGVLVVICPETGKKFSTGIQIDRDDLYTISQDTASSSCCPYCQRDHEWRYRDAEWVAVLPPEDWVENK